MSIVTIRLISIYFFKYLRKMLPQSKYEVTPCENGSSRSRLITFSCSHCWVSVQSISLVWEGFWDNDSKPRQDAAQLTSCCVIKQKQRDLLAQKTHNQRFLSNLPPLPALPLPSSFLGCGRIRLLLDRSPFLAKKRTFPAGADWDMLDCEGHWGQRLSQQNNLSQ